MNVEEYKNYLMKKMEELDIPEHMRDGLFLYVTQGIPPGSFLSSVIQNKLFETFGRADGTNKEKISNYVTLFYNYLPADCWGNEEQYENWVKSEGLKNLS